VKQLWNKQTMKHKLNSSDWKGYREIRGRCDMCRFIIYLFIN